MKKFTFISATILLIFLLCACQKENTTAQHEHIWESATCIKPITCSVCGQTMGSPLSHTWKGATCLTPKTCKSCGLTEGSTAGHSWNNATCKAPKTCYICKLTEGTVGGHSWKNATCTSPKTCITCGKTEGSFSGHQWKSASCTTPKTCTICGTTDGTASGHKWKSATCSSPKTCTICGATEGTAIGHDYASYYGDYKCRNCGQIEPQVAAILNKCSLTLPALPDTVSYCSSSGKTYSSVKVTKIVPEFKYEGDGKVSITVKFSGTKTYDYQGSGQSSSCKIGWKLYDPSGNVLESDTFYSPQVAMGESFADQKETLLGSWNANVPGTYKLVILDVN